MKDTNGRAYATVKDTSVGTKIEVDGGFRCLPNGARRTVCFDEGGLFIHCRDGRHYLDGQQSTDGTYFAGLYPAS